MAVSGSPHKVSTLSSRSDFDRVYSTGRRRRIGGLTVITTSASHDHGRVAFVASRKVGNAVARNRAKRRMRSAFAAAGVVPTSDVVFSASAVILTAPHIVLVGWFQEAVRV